MKGTFSLYRLRSQLRCALGVHRWRGYHDLGDGVNVQPISGYRKPLGANDFRTCSWCGKHHVAIRGGDRVRFFFWGRHVSS